MRLIGRSTTALEAMYSTSELCGNTHLVRKAIYQASGGQSASETFYIDGQALQDLKAQPTVAQTATAVMCPGEPMQPLDKPCKFLSSESVHGFAKAHQFGQPGSAMEEWPDICKVTGAAAPGSTKTLHQPIPVRPNIEDYVSTTEDTGALPAKFKWPPAAAPALADLTNKDRSSAFVCPEAEYEAEDEAAQQSQTQISPFSMDENALLRRYYSEPLAALYSDPDSFVPLPLGTLGSEDSSYSTSKGR